MQLINIGFGNIVSANRIISIVSPESAPIKRLVQEAKDSKMAIDATYGRRTRAVIIMDSGHVILSAVQPETINKKIRRRIIMMVKPTVNELLEKVNDRYRLVLVTSKRARQLAEGAEPLTDKHEDSFVTLAAQEIAEGKVIDLEDEKRLQEEASEENKENNNESNDETKVEK